MSKKNSKGKQFTAFDGEVRRVIPNLASVFDEEDEFVSILVKIKPDATCLAVVKRFGADGTPMVCFGVGYGVVGALFAVDATIQGGHWRVDKPWQPE